MLSAAHHRAVWGESCHGQAVSALIDIKQMRCATLIDTVGIVQKSLPNHARLIDARNRSIPYSILRPNWQCLQIQHACLAQRSQPFHNLRAQLIGRVVSTVRKTVSNKW
jgi:hypothetical protein